MSAVEVVIEVRRRGRRPRYHRGARVSGSGVYAAPEQCNTDQAGLERRVLEALPLVEPGSPMQRPWAQLCRRCWRGTPVLAAALQE